MSVSDKVSIVLGELCANRKKLKDGQLDRLVEAVRGSRHIFIAGTGRSGLAMRAFANRLGHLGFDVSCIGEISSPHSKEGDFLIIGSGSGETDSLVALARKAKRNRVSVALLTIGDDSTIAKMADLIVQLPGVTPKRIGGKADEEAERGEGRVVEEFVWEGRSGVVRARGVRGCCAGRADYAIE